jgi:DUF4097 and DUF4098 domain-containing protein YvlB
MFWLLRLARHLQKSGLTLEAEMKRELYLIMTMTLLILLTSSLLAQENPSDRLTAPFSDPSKPGTIEVSLINGGITVTGYSGKEVIVTAHTQMEKIDAESAKRKNGLRRLQYNASGLTIEEDNNTMSIGVQSLKHSIDLSIQVPTNTNLQLGCVNNGDIEVKDVRGDIEVNNVNGGVTLENVSGSAVAHALNKDLIVTFSQVEAGKAMSFSSLNGDIDVTLPANVKANVKMKSDNGEIYSDFDIDLASSTNKIVEEKSKKGQYKVSIDEYLYGTINGGGAEFLFSSFNGDIYIRKGK